MKLNRLFRKLHFWGAMLIFIPVMVVIISGILLQVKKEIEWIQPATIKGSGFYQNTTLERLLHSINQFEHGQSGLRADAKAPIVWAQINRIDIRPSKNIAKIRLNDDMEYQVDLATHQVLKKSYRNTDWIEALHDGSWFHSLAKLYVFLPVALVLLVLWFTGGYLLFITLRNKRRAKIKGQSREA